MGDYYDDDIDELDWCQQEKISVVEATAFSFIPVIGEDGETYAAFDKHRGKEVKESWEWSERDIRNSEAEQYPEIDSWKEVEGDTIPILEDCPQLQLKRKVEGE